MDARKKCEDIISGPRTAADVVKLCKSAYKSYSDVISNPTCTVNKNKYATAWSIKCTCTCLMGGEVGLHQRLPWWFLCKDWQGEILAYRNEGLVSVL